ncbi:FAD/NAD(P)-binding domain-containing protein [Peniophora sp. CONT]|nr:FAD/NAD(P)-binding domain-containing protein [Peniophora sp. CONT]
MSDNPTLDAKQPGFSVDEYRPIKVICVGAGCSGIAAGIRFRQRIPNLDLTIYEKEDGVGGAWHANKYPGLTCDIPSHTYQFSFAENTQWSAFYAPGPEIKAYLEGVVHQYKLMPHIHLQHELTSARWDEKVAKWTVTIRRGSDGQEITDIADVLFLGVGGLSRWRWPDIKGLKSFNGTLVHSAQWDVPEEAFEGWKDKNVAVIGNGSTGVQLVATLQPRVKTLTNFVRGKAWLTMALASEKMLALTGQKPDNNDYSFDPDFKKKLEDPVYYRRFRHEIESAMHGLGPIYIKGSPTQVAFKNLVKQETIKKLASKPDLLEKVMPDYPIGCRRITPGPGYLDALCKDNMTLETTHIAQVTKTGIDLVDGRHVPLDVIVCATGYDTTWLYPFPVVGRDGKKLTDRWAAHAEAYITMAIDGFPNLWFANGPNSGLNSGSAVAIIEPQVEYAVAAVAKMQRERLRSIEVKHEAVRDFNDYAQEYFKKTVYRENCNNWYVSPVDGTITGLWPGTCLHLIRTLTHPRWEDFKYEHLDEDQTENKFYWLGDGMTYAEKTMTGDRAWYLNNVDIPPVPQ